MSKLGKGFLWIIILAAITGPILLRSYRIVKQRELGQLKNPSMVVNTHSPSIPDQSNNSANIHPGQTVNKTMHQKDLSVNVNISKPAVSDSLPRTNFWAILFYLVGLLLLPWLIAKKVAKICYSETKLFYIWWLGLLGVGVIPLIFSFKLFPTEDFPYLLGLTFALGLVIYLFILKKKHNYEKGPETILQIITLFTALFYLGLLAYCLIPSTVIDPLRNRFNVWLLPWKILAVIGSGFIIFGCCFLLKLIVNLTRNLYHFLVNLRPNVDKIAQRRDIRELIRLLSYRRDYSIREQATKALQKMGSDAVEPLIALAQTKKNDARITAVQILGKIGDPRAVEPLIACLSETDAKLAKTAADSLAIIVDDRGAIALATTIKQWSSSLYNAQNILLTLVQKIKDDKLRDQILTLIISQIDLVKDLPIKNFLQQLVPGSWKPPVDQTGAIYWIAMLDWNHCLSIGSPAIKPLLNALKNQDKSIRQSAAQTLIKLYQSGEITDVDRSIILNSRNQISQPHTDNTPHYDSKKHTDERTSNDCGHIDYLTEIENRYASSHRPRYRNQISGFIVCMFLN